MNKIFGLALVTACLFFATLTSCKKETVTNTVTNTVTDTLYSNVYDSISMSLITANKWMIEEGRGVRGGNPFYYLRGGNSANNTEDLDDEWIELHSDNSGTYHDQSGTTRTITWEFDNVSNTFLTVHFTNTPADFDVYWDNLRSTNGKLYFDEYYQDGNLGWLSHCQMIREPKP